ncbi:unnamed protein product [Somion occarium]|uniref:Uncharacterized protein n=1 Tax=Somion occarium TaxID=3059160 RepID=A0ABP1EBK9_9APHY
MQWNVAMVSADCPLGRRFTIRTPSRLYSLSAKLAKVHDNTQCQISSFPEVVNSPNQHVQLISSRADEQVSVEVHTHSDAHDNPISPASPVQDLGGMQRLRSLDGPTREHHHGVCGRSEPSSNGCTHKASEPTTRPTTKTATGSIASIASKHSTVFLLRQFLAGRIDMSSPTRNSPRGIRALYLSLRQRSLLHLLTEQDMSTLIGLYGALSVFQSSSNSTNDELVDDSPFLAPTVRRIIKHIDVGTPRTYWTLLAMIVIDKKGLGMKLTLLDKYWIMRGRLAEVANITDSHSLARDEARIESLLHETRSHYRSLTPLINHPNLHLPFLRTLMSVGLTDEVVFRLGQILKRDGQVHPRLQALVWELILSRGHELTQDGKEKLLNCLIQPPSRLSPSSESEPTPFSESSHSFAIDNVVVSVGKLADMFAARLFNPTNEHIPTVLWDWVTSTILSALMRVSDLEVAYRNMVLLALVKAPASFVALQPSLPLFDSSAPGSSDWQTICALALLERTISPRGYTAEPLQEGLAKDLQHMLSFLWDSWSVLEDTRPAVVATAILSSFVYIAGRTKDTRISDACLKYAAAANLFARSNGTAPSLDLSRLVAEYTITQVTNGVDLRTAVHDLLNLLPDLANASEALSQVIVRLCPTALQVAYRLRNVAEHSGMSLSSYALRLLGITFAQAGQLDIALTFVTEPYTLPRHRADILEAIAATIAINERNALTQDLAVKLVTSMSRVFRKTPPSEKSTSNIEETVLSILSTEHPTGAIAVVLAIHASHPGYFTSTFLDTLFRTLVDQRFFRLSSVLFASIHEKYNKVCTRWYGLLMEQYCNADAHHLMRRLRKFRTFFPTRNLWLDRLHCGRRTTRVRTFWLQRLADAHLIPLRYQPKALDLLLRTCRLRAGKRLFYQYQSQHSKETSTVMGNSLLTSVFRHKDRSPPKRLRLLMSILEELTSQSSYVPDRVTLNILLKAFLHLSYRLDANAVRALFDRVILSGYPTGGVVPPGRSIFNVEPNALIDSIQFPELDPEISFERHVKPLYKMFITALFTRGDAQGGRKVVGILKVLQEQDERRKKLQQQTIS